jgi:chloramphenicol-sensitive protein RarD
VKKDGVLAAIGAYTLWGLLPIYWKAVQSVSADELLCQRALWSFVLLALFLGWKRRWAWLRQVRNSATTLATFLGSACLLALNWLVYIWAVNAGHIVDASLGYFINPLISVCFGMLFLGERLRPWQWVAIGIAGTGVVLLTLGYGAFPWIALTLAITFGLYGLLRKTAPLEALEGLALEMSIMSLPALAYLVYLASTGAASFGRADTATRLLLVLSGPITALPLFLFGYGARRITLASVGILQYIAPTCQFLLGVLVYEETFTPARMVGFGVIWTALLVYSLEGAIESQRRKSRAFSVS